MKIGQPKTQKIAKATNSPLTARFIIPPALAKRPDGRAPEKD
jgi:hypothetical protein